MIPYRPLLFLCIMAIGCASIPMTSVTDPAGKGKQYQRFIVWAKVSDLNMRREMERRVAQRLEEAGAECASSLDLLPPTTEYSDNDITTVLWARGIEGFLILSVNESARSHVSASPGTAEGNKAHSWVSIQSELFDVLHQRRAWASMARTKESDDASLETVARYCDKIVEQMLADKLLLQKQRPSPSLNGSSATP